MPRTAVKLGPGLLVTAAFVGPGTIATASSAGALFGYSLVWALVFSVMATVVLQEMAARQSLVTRRSLAENLRRAMRTQLMGRLLLLLVIAAIGIGNAAYEAGNLSGAGLALSSVAPLSSQTWSVVIAAGAAWLLWQGQYRTLETVLIILVVIMSIVFLVCAAILLPGIALLRQTLQPALPAGSLTTAIALIGTTVVPYNLFLHASAATNTWSTDTPITKNLSESRRDAMLSIAFGGLITLAIMSTAAVTFFGQTQSADGLHMAEQLRSVFGAASETVFAIGLFASGLTSALTAPVAAGFAVAGALGRRAELNDPVCRGVALSVLATGAVFAGLGSRPLSAILFAQAANGILLPVVAIALLMMMNRKDLLGEHVNTPRANLLGIAVVLVAVALGLSKLLSLA